MGERGRLWRFGCLCWERTVAFLLWTGNTGVVQTIDTHDFLDALISCLLHNIVFMKILQPPCGQLNPINDNTYEVLGK